MRYLPFAVMVSSLLAGHVSPARAAEAPRPGPADPRMRTIDYDPSQVFRIVAAARTAIQIRFSDAETILHVALGDSSGWEVAPEKNLLFAKPTAQKPATNLIVTTELAAGEVRNYVFELSKAPSASAGGAFYVVQFHYPADEKARAANAVAAAAQVLDERILQLKLERGVVEGPRNLAYELQGSTAIAPSEVSDNGRFTVLRFPGAQPLPAVYAVGPDGAESLTPFDVRGEFLVIHQIASQFRLRRGREVLCVFNTAYRAAGAPTGTATSAHDVERTGPQGSAP